MTRRATYASLLSLALCVLGADSARADAQFVVDWWSAQVPYSATLAELPQSRAFPGRLYYDQGRVRHEAVFNDALFVSVYLPEHQRKYVFTPGGEMLPSNCIDFWDVVADNVISATALSQPVGREMVNGEETTKYRMTLPKGQSSNMVFSWITDDGIVMRTAASDGEVLLELSEVTRGPVHADLFDLPNGVPFCAPERMDQ